MPGPPRGLRRLAPTSLTGRLVAILVLVVVLAGAVVALVTSLAMRSYLYGRLDDDVAEALDRAVGAHDRPFAGRRDDGPGGDGDGSGGRDGDGDRRAPLGLGDPRGSLRAEFDPVGEGAVVTSRITTRPLSTAALDRLAKVPADGRIHEVDLPGFGSFRVKVAASDSVRLVAGRSSDDVDEATGQLVLWELLLTLTAVAAAALAGRWLVRRQLQPLRDVAATAHEVADLPLSRGEIGTTVRVPETLTDERTEVGAVGAALNTMLEHVEHALDDRHRSEQQVRQFVADASHELRTPLSTIHGYAELSRRTSPGDPAQLELAMAKVEAEATRMSGLVEDLLLLARLDAGRPLARDEVDLTKLVLETVDDARVVGPGHRWLLDLSDEPVLVPGDGQRLHQVVTNLLNNARRHTPPGTTVQVGVHEDGRDGVLFVEDDGPGIPPQLVDTVFERFTRGDSSRTRESGGAGLGLSLVQAIATAHAGAVTLTSRPGRTRFEVRLPAVHDTTSARAAPDPAHS